MKYLLDTHAVLWALTARSLLSVRIAAILADPQSELFISAASSWEIATKYRLGKLPMAGPLLENYEQQIELAGFHLLSITSQHARIAGSLPGKHGDPFDRMLAAQARVENPILLSNDKHLDSFGIERI